MCALAASGAEVRQRFFCGCLVDPSSSLGLGTRERPTSCHCHCTLPHRGRFGILFTRLWRWQNTTKTYHGSICGNLFVPSTSQWSPEGGEDGPFWLWPLWLVWSTVVPIPSATLLPWWILCYGRGQRLTGCGR